MGTTGFSSPTDKRIAGRENVSSQSMNQFDPLTVRWENCEPCSLAEFCLPFNRCVISLQTGTGTLKSGLRTVQALGGTR